MNAATYIKLNTTTTHVILNQRNAHDHYTLWSQHQSEAAATKLLATLGRNGLQGHSVAVAKTDIAQYIK